MNRKTLQKIIDNLRSEKPDLSYCLGVLDTLIEGLPEEITSPVVEPTIIRAPIGLAPKDPEAEALDNIAKANMAKVRAMGGII